MPLQIQTAGSTHVQHDAADSGADGLSDSQEFLDAIVETTVTDDEERLTELFTYLYNYDIGNVIDIPLNYYKDVIVYNSEKIAGYEFDSAPCFFDVARLTPQ